MTRATAFRSSTFLTLGAACCCLGYAEAILFPEVGALAALVAVLLLVIYRVESREQLSVRAANWLGGIIAVIYVAWAAARVVRASQASEFADLGWQLLMLPLFGPILLV